MGQAVVALHRVEHALHHRAGQLVAEMGRVHGGRVPAQPVHRQAVADQRVVGVGQRARVRLERHVQGLERPPPKVAVGVAHVREQPVDGVRLLALPGVERHLERGGDLAEKGLPRADGGRAALGEHALLGLGQRVRGEAPQRHQVVAVAGHLGRVVELAGAVLGQRDPLEVEEAEGVRGLHQAPVDRCREVLVLLAHHVHRLAQVGVGAHPRQLVVDGGQLGQRLGQLGGVDGLQGPSVAGLERAAPLEAVRQAPAGLGGVRDEGGEVPVDAGGAPAGGGCVGGGGHAVNVAATRVQPGAGQEPLDRVEGEGRVAGVAGAQRLVEAVEVRSPRGHQAVAPRQGGEGVAPLGRVVGSMDLDPPEAGLRQPADEGRQRVGGQAQRGRVGQGRRTAGLAHQAHGLLGTEGLVRHRGGTAVVEEALEGVLAVARVAGGHDGVGDVRAADRPAGPGPDVRHVHGRTGLGEPPHDPLGARLPRAAHLLQAVPQGGGRLIAEVPQQVQGARGRRARTAPRREPPARPGGPRPRRPRPPRPGCRGRSPPAPSPRHPRPARTSADGDRAPSEARVWEWRSALPAGAATRPPRGR